MFRNLRHLIAVDPTDPPRIRSATHHRLRQLNEERQEATVVDDAALLALGIVPRKAQV